MEMTKKELEKLKDFKVYNFEGDVYVKAEDYKEIAIENKNLKEEIEIQKKLNLGERMEYLRYIDELEEENKKLDEALKDMTRDKAKVISERLILEEENKTLKEKVETLELWLDNKEKLNEEYRKQLDKYKRQYEHSMGFMEEDTLQELRDIGEI